MAFDGTAGGVGMSSTETLGGNSSEGSAVVALPRPRERAPADGGNGDDWAAGTAGLGGVEEVGGLSATLTTGAKGGNGGSYSGGGGGRGTVAAGQAAPARQA